MKIAGFFIIAAMLLAGCSSSPPPGPSRGASDSQQMQTSGLKDHDPSAMPSNPLPPEQPPAPTTRPAKWYESADPGLNLPPPRNLPRSSKKDESIVNRPTGTFQKERDAAVNDNEDDRPGPNNTGVRDQKNLKRSEKIEAKDGQVIENLFIAGGIKASDKKDIIIRNCVIDAAGGRYGVVCQGGKNILIENCEIYGMSSAGVYGDGYTARGNNVSQSKGDGFKAGNDVVIEKNYVHTLGFNSPGAHADGVQIRGASNIKIIGNYFDMPINVPNTHSNAAVFIQDEKPKNRPTNHVLVEGNWFRGGNYTVSAYTGSGGDPATLKVLNNRFYQGEARYGSGRVQEGVQWSGNVFAGSGMACSPAAK
jgi:hypothetical protein